MVRLVDGRMQVGYQRWILQVEEGKEEGGGWMGIYLCGRMRWSFVAS